MGDIGFEQFFGPSAPARWAKVAATSELVSEAAELAPDDTAVPEPLSAMMDLLKNIQVWRFALYYFFVFGGFGLRH
mgnify:CR=1 FL=1